MRTKLLPLFLAASIALAGCVHSEPGPPPEETTVSQDRLSLDEAATNVESTLDALRRVVDETIPAAAWKADGESFRTGCESLTEGEFVTPHYRAPGKQLPPDAWPVIEQALIDHGFRPSSNLPVDGSSAIRRFSNEFGDQITVTSVADGVDSTGGSSYYGETSCHGGYVRRTAR